MPGLLHRAHRIFGLPAYENNMTSIHIIIHIVSSDEQLDVGELGEWLVTRYWLLFSVKIIVISYVMHWLSTYQRSGIVLAKQMKYRMNFFFFFCTKILPVFNDLHLGRSWIPLLKTNRRQGCALDLLSRVLCGCFPNLTYAGGVNLL